MSSKMVWQVLILVITVLINNVSCQNCATTPQHTMCKYSGPKSTCSIRNRGIDPTVQNYIVTKHNEYRARVKAGLELRGNPGPQPGATETSLLPLRWNVDLAQVAQRWTDQCTLGTDKYRNIEITPGAGPVWVGQNPFGFVDATASVAPYTTATQQQYWMQAIDRWYNEVVNYDSRTVSNYVYNASTGKYTQVVWGTTTDIGCGFTQWNYSNNRVARLLICNYGPGGNQVGFAAYQTLPTGGVTSSTTPDPGTVTTTDFPNGPIDI